MICRNIKTDNNYNIIIREGFDDQYVYVYILQHTSTTGNDYNKVIIKESKYQEVKFNTKKDGFYTIITLLIPVDKNSYYYYKDQKFYRNQEEVSIEEIINTNPKLSNIYPNYDYYFLLARLKNCYINACKKIFESSVKCLKNENKDLIYNRDLIWSSLNVLEYMVEFEQYEEAQRLLEELTGCNGICQEEETKHCGCHE